MLEMQRIEWLWTSRRQSGSWKADEATGTPHNYVRDRGVRRQSWNMGANGRSLPRLRYERG